MAAAAVEPGSMAEGGEPGVGKGQGATGQAAGGDQATNPKGEPGGVSPRSAAAVVRQRSGSDDGGGPRPGGVRDVVASHRRGQAGRRTTAQKEDWPDVCHRRPFGNRGAV